MTEQNETMSQTSNMDISHGGGSISNSQTTPVSTGSSVGAEEKFLPQSRVNELVGQTRQQAREEGYARARQEFEGRQSDRSVSQGIDPADFDRLLDMRVEKARLEAQKENEQKQQEENERYCHEIANTFVSKIQAGQQKYSDFDSKVEALNLASPAMASVIPHLHDVDNVADIVYELANNPRKLVELEAYSRMSPALVKQQIQQLSASISQNDKATQQSRPRPPLSQVTPSIAGMDNGEPTISDLRKNPKYRV